MLLDKEAANILKSFEPAPFDPIEYAMLKRSIAYAIQPRSIVEIGIGMGVAALAFLEASPIGVTYTGIDNDCEYGKKFSVHPTEYVRNLLGEHGYHVDVISADSQSLDALPGYWYDLAHIDGDHSALAVEHDFILSWNAGAKWILCDDARDAEVCRGIFNALHLIGRGSTDWAYFPEGSGSILVRTDHKLESK